VRSLSRHRDRAIGIEVRDPAGGEALLIGIEAFISTQAQIATGHNLLSVGYGRLEGGGWYLVRRSNGH